MLAAKDCRVPWEMTRWKCDESEFHFACTDDIPPLDRIIGQDRALAAMRFGLEVDKPGYNLFVTGLTGTGKTSAVKSLLQAIIENPPGLNGQKQLDDWCYVHNFDDPDHPHALRLPQGMARNVRTLLGSALLALREEIPTVFQSDEYQARLREIEASGSNATRQLTGALEDAARSAGFAVQVSPVGLSIFPMKGDQPLSPEEHQAMVPEQQKAIEQARAILMQQAQDIVAAVRQAENATADQVVRLERESSSSRVNAVFANIMEAAAAAADLQAYLTRTVEYVLDHLYLFGSPPAAATQSEAIPVHPTPVPAGSALARNPFLPFEINVLVDNTGATSAPIVEEPNPNWRNLFGSVERSSAIGPHVSDHTMLKAGSFHTANGGYLIINARDLLVFPGVWDAMKRIIRNREIGLEDPAEHGAMLSPMGLRPEPVPLDVKVIITGDELIYRTLATADQEEFNSYFKVKAEFDHQVALTPDTMDAYCSFICATCRDEKLMAFDAGGAARVLEHGARLVSDQAKLSTRFGQIKDLLIEADYWARKDGCALVSSDHVTQAVAQRDYRHNLAQERLRDLVTQGLVLLDVAGEKVGQVNGLAVYDVGDFSFGRPSRITSEIYAGREGVINIEREASLSGRTHDKGVLILSGYLGAKYGQDRPLALSGSLAFEQSYDGVDGDSASSTELYAILSSLSGMPIKQGIAVTGSINQKGEIQPIGGVNQKVEGMYDVCRALGLTGDQGVMIPRRNLRNLMLRSDVVEAVKDGKFHVFAIDTVDQGMEILTGHSVGQPGEDGRYPEGTLNEQVERRLEELRQSIRGYYGDMASAPEPRSNRRAPLPAVGPYPLLVDDGESVNPEP